MVKCGCNKKQQAGRQKGDHVQDLKDNHWNDEEIEFAVEFLKKSGDVEWNEDGSFIVRIV